MEDTITMYRPTGPEELELVKASGFRCWPPRLPAQANFHSVINEQTAIKIATRESSKESGVGFVTRFAVRSAFAKRYEIQTVGGAHHTEWWIPSEELAQLNQNIVGTIEVIGEYCKPI